MAFAIRRAEPMDWPNIRDLLEQEELPTGDLDEDRMDSFLVAESPQGDIVGAIGIEAYGETALLRSLVISPGSRQGGVGRALIERLAASAASDGVTELWLLTIDASAFFARLGFELRSKGDSPESIRQTDEFSSLCPDTAHLMSRRIVDG